MTFSRVNFCQCEFLSVWNFFCVKLFLCRMVGFSSCGLWSVCKHFFHLGSFTWDFVLWTLVRLSLIWVFWFRPFLWLFSEYTKHYFCIRRISITVPSAPQTAWCSFIWVYVFPFLPSFLFLSFFSSPSFRCYLVCGKYLFFDNVKNLQKKKNERKNVCFSTSKIIWKCDV